MTSDMAPSKFNSIGRNAIDGLIQGIGGRSSWVHSAVRNLSYEVIGTLSREFSSRDFEIIGSNAAIGLAWGIEDRIWDIANAAIRAARSAIRAAENELDTHSPSRVFFKIGQNVDQGLADGILRYASLVGRASEKMSNETIDASDDILSGLTRISTGMSDSVDFDPTITPKMDFTQIQKDYDTLLAMMNQSIEGTYMKASGIGFIANDPRQMQALEMNSAMQGLSSSISGIERPNGPVYNNEFYIQGEDPEAIAQEVSVILQKQVERREAVWGQ